MCPSKEFPIDQFLPPGDFRKAFGNIDFLFEDIRQRTDDSFISRYHRIKLETKVKDPEKEMNRGFRYEANTAQLPQGPRVTDPELVKAPGVSHAPEMIAVTARLRYIVEGAGSSLADWTLTRPPSYSFSQGKFQFEDPSSWKDILDPAERLNLCGNLSETECFKVNENSIPRRKLVREDLEQIDMSISSYLLNHQRKYTCKKLVDLSHKALLNEKISEINPASACQTNLKSDRQVLREESMFKKLLNRLRHIR
jgi:hypothetical protein